MIESEQMDFGEMLFPGRKSLVVAEVAERLEVTVQHVLNLIEEGKMGAVDVGSTGGRKYWRIPVAEYDKFLKKRSSVNGGDVTTVKKVESLPGEKGAVGNSPQKVLQ